MIIFGVGTMYGVPLSDASGAAISNPTPVKLGVLQEVQGDMSFDEKTLYGANQFPLAFGRGKGKFTFKAKAADFSAQALGSLFFGASSSAGIQATVDGESHAAATTITITPPASGTYTTDYGVLYSATGLPLTRVASAPSVGQYSVNTGTGVYTFNASEVGTLLISYEYTATSTSAAKFNITNQLMGYAPTFQAELSLPFNGHQYNLKLLNCVSSKITLPFKNEDFSVQEFDFTALDNGSGSLGVWSLK